MGSISLWILLGHARNKKLLGRSAVVVTVWSVAVAADYVFQVRAVNRVEFFFYYWRDAFLPTFPHTVRDVHRFVSICLTAFTAPFETDAPADNLTGYRLSMVTMYLCIAGGTLLWKQLRRTTLLLLLLPVAAAVVASALHRYPLKGRMLMFVFPILATLMSVALVWLLRHADRWVRAVGYAAAVGVFLPALFQLSDTALLRPQPEATRLAMMYIPPRWHAGDGLYVTKGSRPGYQFYRQYRHLLETVPEADTFFQPETETAQSRQEMLDRLSKYPRVWVIHSHDSSPGVGDLVSAALRATNTPLDNLEFDGAGVYLYGPTGRAGR